MFTLLEHKTYLVQEVIPLVQERGLEPLDKILLVA